MFFRWLDEIGDVQALPHDNVRLKALLTRDLYSELKWLRWVHMYLGSRVLATCMCTCALTVLWIVRSKDHEKPSWVTLILYITHIRRLFRSKRSLSFIETIKKNQHGYWICINITLHSTVFVRIVRVST